MPAPGMGDRLIPVALRPLAGRPQTQLAAPSVGRAWPPLNMHVPPSVPCACSQVAAGGRVRQYFEGVCGQEEVEEDGDSGGSQGS